VVYDTISSKPFQILQSKVKETGKIPVISQSSNYIEGYSDQEEFIFKNSDAVLVFGDHTRNLKYIDFDFIVGADGVKILKPLIYAPFAYYSLLPIIEKMRNRGYARHYGVLAKSLIPIPPINEEHRIVARIEELFAVLDGIKESLEV
jgi:type I restriction enzyme S subunit